MSLGMRLGARGNLLDPGPDSYRQIILDSPVLLESDLEAVKRQDMVPTEARAGTPARSLADLAAAPSNPGMAQLPVFAFRDAGFQWEPPILAVVHS
jgi:Glutamate synthase central domain